MRRIFSLSKLEAAGADVLEGVDAILGLVSGVGLAGTRIELDADFVLLHEADRDAADDKAFMLRLAIATVGVDCSAAVAAVLPVVGVVPLRGRIEEGSGPGCRE